MNLLCVLETRAFEVGAVGLEAAVVCMVSSALEPAKQFRKVHSDDVA